jgi:hypothetical protein
MAMTQAIDKALRIAGESMHHAHFAIVLTEKERGRRCFSRVGQNGCIGTNGCCTANLRIYGRTEGS